MKILKAADFCAAYLYLSGALVAFGQRCPPHNSLLRPATCGNTDYACTPKKKKEEKGREKERERERVRVFRQTHSGQTGNGQGQRERGRERERDIYVCCRVKNWSNFCLF